MPTITRVHVACVSRAAKSMSARAAQRASLVAIAAFSLCAGCTSTSDNGLLGSIDLGSDIIPPDIALDEETFVCRIQPEVLTRHSCATGMNGESCHSSRSAFRLIDVTDDPPCNAENEITGSVPDDIERNFEAVRFVVQADPETSPFYLRPTGRAAHPRTIFGSDDPAAELIAEWIAQGAQ